MIFSTSEMRLHLIVRLPYVFETRNVKMSSWTSSIPARLKVTLQPVGLFLDQVNEVVKRHPIFTATQNIYFRRIYEAVDFVGFMGSESSEKMNNTPFYRQQWFYPVCALICIIMYLQVMPTGYENHHE